MTLEEQYADAIARVREMSADEVQKRWHVSWRCPEGKVLTQVYEPQATVMIPEWLKGVHVDWSYDYDNKPSFIFVIDKVGAMSEEKLDARKFRFVSGVGKNQGYYISESEGIAEIHFHGPATQVLTDYRLPSGKLVPSIKATPQSQGYAGRHFVITMEDDSLVVLRGPWHGGSSLPYTDVSTLRIGQSLATFGFKFSNDLVESALAFFRPEIRCACFESREGKGVKPSWEWVHKDYMIPKDSWTPSLRQHIKALEKVNDEQIQENFPGTLIRR